MTEPHTDDHPAPLSIVINHEKTAITYDDDVIENIPVAYENLNQSNTLPIVEVEENVVMIPSLKYFLNFVWILVIFDSIVLIMNIREAPNPHALIGLMNILNGCLVLWCKPAVPKWKNYVCLLWTKLILFNIFMWPFSQQIYQKITQPHEVPVIYYFLVIALVIETIFNCVIFIGLCLFRYR